MSLVTQITALAQAIGADVKALTTKVNAAAPRGDVQVFTTAGTYSWTRPSWATATSTVQIVAIGGGGAGGNGCRGAAGTVRNGGNGGNGAAWSYVTLPGSAIPASLTVTVGAGGVPSPVATTDDTPGKTGNNGNPSIVLVDSATTLLTAPRGAGGYGGTAGAQLAQPAPTGSLAPASAGGTGGGSASATQPSPALGTGGGGGGGGRSATNGFPTPANGGAAYFTVATPGLTNGVQPTKGPGPGTPGAGGAGGATQSGANSGDGQNGALYGGGGGGGAGGENGYLPGRGGKGGDGCVVIYVTP